MGKCFLEASRAAPTFSGRLRELLQKSAVNFYEMEEADGEQGPQCDVAAKMWVEFTKIKKNGLKSHF
jgi:hypothetical protein